MSDLAKQLIAENKRSRDTFLDLGKCGLTEVPAEVGKLIWLEGLSLANEWYEWDGRGWKLEYSQNTLDEHSPLANSGSFDLSPLAGLSGLQTLILSDTLVADLAPLAGLFALQNLILAIAPVANLTPLAGLTALSALVVSSTQVTDLTPLACSANA